MGAKASPESLQGAALAIFSDAAGIAEFVFPLKREQHFLKRRGPNLPAKRTWNQFRVNFETSQRGAARDGLTNPTRE